MLGMMSSARQLPADAVGGVMDYIMEVPSSSWTSSSWRRTAAGAVGGGRRCLGHDIMIDTL